MEEWVTVQCPWCGESFDTAVDASAGDQQYVEDCQVCCQPILLDVAVGAGGQASLAARREGGD